jgi:Xaa-Pro dipeptidase
MERAKFFDIPPEQPFPKTEFDSRLRRTRAAMRREELDLLLLHSIPNICYLTGFETPLADWYHCLIVPIDSEPVLQVCDPELALMNTYIETILPVSWERMDEAVGQLASHLASLHAGANRIGIEMRRPGLNANTARLLHERLPNANFVDASDLVPKVRAVKSPLEIVCLREAARISTRGMEAAIAMIRPGITENEICAAAMQTMVSAGSEYFCIDPIVRAGRRSGVTHATCNRGVVRPGDSIIMEFGGVYQRYCAPLLRAAVVGEPPERLRRLADASLQAMDSLFANLRPGRTMGDVATAVTRAQINADPAVKTRGYFGYSVGIGFPPSWVERSVEIAEGREELLMPGMTFHIHRSMRVPGLMGVGFSEIVVITESGYDTLTGLPRQLFVL